MGAISSLFYFLLFLGIGAFSIIILRWEEVLTGEEGSQL